MSLERLWSAHRDGATVDELRASVDTGQERFYLAALAYCLGDHGGAADLAAQSAEDDPGRVVYAETARYLGSKGNGTADVYASPEPFTAFATGGGNVGLYRAAHEALRDVYADHSVYTDNSGIRLLDIGCGEGHALLPALTSEVVEVDAVEPSAERLALVSAELTRRGVAHTSHACTVQEFTERADAGPWDLMQETFALLTLPRPERIDLFRWLRPRTARLALIEFDVPLLGSGLEPGRFRYLVDAYERGLREYGESRDLVAQGFLVPVLLDTLAQTGDAHSEQPIDHWVQDVAAAGFTPQAPRHVHDYWWAPAYLVTAT